MAGIMEKIGEKLHMGGGSDHKKEDEHKKEGGHKKEGEHQEHRKDGEHKEGMVEKIKDKITGEHGGDGKPSGDHKGKKDKKKKEKKHGEGHHDDGHSSSSSDSD